MAYNAARALSGSEIAGGGIWNSGTANLNNARVERNQADGTALAGGVSYVSASGSGWSCSFGAPTVTCTAATLSVGAAPAIQIVATAPMTPGLLITNTASVNAATRPNTPATSNSVVVKVQYRVFAPIVRKP